MPVGTKIPSGIWKPKQQDVAEHRICRWCFDIHFFSKLSPFWEDNFLVDLRKGFKPPGVFQFFFLLSSVSDKEGRESGVPKSLMQLEYIMKNPDMFDTDYIVSQK